MANRDLLSDRQAQPVAALEGGGLRAAPMPLENMRQLLGRDPVAIVPHFKHVVCSLAVATQPNVSGVLAVTDGVRYQVVEHDRDLLGIELDDQVGCDVV